MNQIFILFRDVEFSHGEREVIGWFNNKAAASHAAHTREWADYHEESAEVSVGSIRLSPDQTEYRRYTIKAADLLDD